MTKEDVRVAAETGFLTAQIPPLVERGTKLVPFSQMPGT